MNRNEGCGSGSVGLCAVEKTLSSENGRRKESRNFGVLKKKERIRKEFLESTERRRASP